MLIIRHLELVTLARNQPQLEAPLAELLGGGSKSESEIGRRHEVERGRDCKRKLSRACARSMRALDAGDGREVCAVCCVLCVGHPLRRRELTRRATHPPTFLSRPFHCASGCAMRLVLPKIGRVEVPKSCECRERTKSGSALATSSFTEAAAGDSCSGSSIVGERRLLPAAPERSSPGESRPQAEKIFPLTFAGARSVLAGLKGRGI